MAAVSVVILSSNDTLSRSLERLLRQSGEISVESLVQDSHDLTALSVMIEAANPIILLVIRLPAGEDIKLLRYLRTQHPKARILALLMDDAEDYAKMASAVGATESLPVWGLAHTLFPVIRRFTQAYDDDPLRQDSP